MKKLTKRGKILIMACVMAVMAAVSCVSCFAVEGDVYSSMLTTFTSSLTQIQNAIFQFIAAALPIALVIFGAFFVIKKAMSFFNKSASKG